MTDNVSVERAILKVASKIHRVERGGVYFKAENRPNGFSLKPRYLFYDHSFFFYLHPPIVSSYDSICISSSLLDVWSSSLNWHLLLPYDQGLPLMASQTAAKGTSCPL